MKPVSVFILYTDGSEDECEVQKHERTITPGAIKTDTNATIQIKRNGQVEKVQFRHGGITVFEINLIYYFGNPLFLATTDQFTITAEILAKIDKMGYELKM